VRRSEHEITDRAKIDAIIRGCQVCRLGLADGGEPYVVPLCFGYDGSALYFHCAAAGRKLDMLRTNSRVCFEFDVVGGIRPGGPGVRLGHCLPKRHRSRQGAVPEWPTEKRRGLQLIMAQYSDGQEFSFPDEAVNRTTLIKVAIESIAGKEA